MCYAIRFVSVLALLGLPSFMAIAHAESSGPPVGTIQGSAWVHTPTSQAAAIQQAQLCLPANVAGGSLFCGLFRDAPKTNDSRVPTVVFLHGSSGLGLKAIREWQEWLAGLGWASLAPDSFALAEHVTYQTPIDKTAYEKIHALRASEIDPAIQSLQSQNWADMTHLVLAGTSEGAVPVARYSGPAFIGRILYAWSCETNYFVEEPRNAFPSDHPVLNVISTTDPYFSASNAWLGNPAAQGHCGAAFKNHPHAAVVLVPNAPHTLLNLPATRFATAGFLNSLFSPKTPR